MRVPAGHARTAALAAERLHDPHSPQGRDRRGRGGAFARLLPERRDRPARARPLCTRKTHGAERRAPAAVWAPAHAQHAVLLPGNGDGAGIPSHIRGRSSLSVSYDAAREHHPHQYPGGPPGLLPIGDLPRVHPLRLALHVLPSPAHAQQRCERAQGKADRGHGQQGQQEPPAVARMAGKSRQLWADDAAVHDARPGAGRGSQSGRL